MTLSGRNSLLKHISPNKNGLDTTIMNKYRAKWLNAHTATLSRIVLDTMYRGVGVAYRAMNIAMRMTGYDMLEFQSSMSRVNPFAQKAGVVFAKPKRNVAYGKGLCFLPALVHFHPNGLCRHLRRVPNAFLKQNKFVVSKKCGRSTTTIHVWKSLATIDSNVAPA